MHHNKSFKMRVPKKHPKHLSKIQFSDAFWLPKTFQKSKKNRIENDVEKRCRKKLEKSAMRAPLEKPVLARNGKRDLF